VDALKARGLDAELLVADRLGPHRWSGAMKLPAAIRASALEDPPTIVHDHGLWLATNHAATATARRAHLALVVSPRGMLTPWALGYRRWKKRVAWTAYQRRDLATAVLHATSEAEALGFRAVGLRNAIAVVPNGVHVPVALRPEQSPERRTALFLGRMHPGKGILSLIEAWARVRPPAWQLIVIGPDEGGYREQLARLIGERGLTGLVRLEGPVDEDAKWRQLQGADLFVLPTLSENFGLVVAEALACGVPAITTRAAPWSELESHRCGWWIDAGTEPLVSALRQATEAAPEVRQAMGQNGRCLVLQRYSWNHIAEQMASVYAWMANRGTAPACVSSD
jgi:glycosyltransferase involved in cell wall biosynthesis